jgi:hypothetical protein
MSDAIIDTLIAYGQHGVRNAPDTSRFPRSSVVGSLSASGQVSGMLEARRKREEEKVRRGLIRLHETNTCCTGDPREQEALRQRLASRVSLAQGAWMCVDVCVDVEPDPSLVPRRGSGRKQQRQYRPL